MSWLAKHNQPPYTNTTPQEQTNEHLRIYAKPNWSNLLVPSFGLRVLYVKFTKQTRIPLLTQTAFPSRIILFIFNHFLIWMFMMTVTAVSHLTRWGPTKKPNPKPWLTLLQNLDGIFVVRVSSVRTFLHNLNPRDDLIWSKFSGMEEKKKPFDKRKPKSKPRQPEVISNFGLERRKKERKKAKKSPFALPAQRNKISRQLSQNKRKRRLN